MNVCRKTGGALLLLVLFVFLVGCSTVPKEVVELSYLSGRDLRAVHESYDALIHQFYENLRDQRRTYLDEVWYPRFLENWRQDGELVGIAKGERIWSVEAGDLIDTPPGTDAAESVATLNDWVTYALYAYEVKEQQLVAPLDADEEKLRTQVRQSFDRLAQANATITAHLNSLREVQEVQDEMLESLDMKDLRDQINTGLANASANAAEALTKVKAADAKVDDLVGQIDDHLDTP